jgi:Ca2+-binding RTX toxin-like protein
VAADLDALSPGEAFVSATATSVASGDTSEFSVAQSATVFQLSAGGTVHVATGGYPDYTVGDKAVTVAFVGGPRLQMDSTSDVRVTGTDGNDRIQFAPAAAAAGAAAAAAAAAADAIRVEIAGFPTGIFHPAGRLIASGLGGDDDVQVAGSIGLSAWLYGGSGSDRLKGAAGHDVLLGEDRDDLLVGGDGRDLYLRLHETILDDEDDSRDMLTGSNGEDWFFLWSPEDKATDLKDEVFANDLDWILNVN